MNARYTKSSEKYMCIWLRRNAPRPQRASARRQRATSRSGSGLCVSAPVSASSAAAGAGPSAVAPSSSGCESSGCASISGTVRARTPLRGWVRRQGRESERTLLLVLVLASKKRNQLDRRLRFLLRRLIKILRPPFDLHAPVRVVRCVIGAEFTPATRTHRWRARNPCFCFIFRRFGCAKMEDAFRACVVSARRRGQGSPHAPGTCA